MVGGVGARNLVFVAEPGHLSIGQPHALEEMVEHHEPAERSRQRRHQQRVIAASHDTGHCP